MNPGDNVQDVSRTGPDEASGSAAAAGQGNGTLTRSPGTEKPLQDIQDIIDKLAAVNRQLRHPKSSAASRSN
jgi:hypothetical protein